MQEAAVKAGELLARRFKENTGQIDEINDWDVKLAVDKESDAIIKTLILENFPTDIIYSEEGNELTDSSEYQWYVDPLDGSNNFVIGVPYFGVSIALRYQGETVACSIYLPVITEHFVAIKGEGVKLNGKKIRIQTASSKTLAQSVLSWIRGHRVFSDKLLLDQANLLEKKFTSEVRRVLSFWSPVSDWTLVAKGLIDIIISFEDDLYEEYAGILLAQEAGAVVEFLDQEQYPHRIIAGNPKLIAELQTILNS